MWHATGKMAEAIGDGLVEAGIACAVRNVSVTDRNDLITEIFKSTGIIVGSSTVNNGILPTLAPLMHDIKGHKFKNKVAAAFGSYGWSGEATVVVEDFLRAGGFEIVADGLKAKWRPGPEKLAECRALGRHVAAAAAGCPVN
jgi:flavorubredoxin